MSLNRVTSYLIAVVMLTIIHLRHRHISLDVYKSIYSVVISFFISILYLSYDNSIILVFHHFRMYKFRNYKYFETIRHIFHWHAHCPHFNKKQWMMEHINFWVLINFELEIATRWKTKDVVTQIFLFFLCIYFVRFNISILA